MTKQSWCLVFTYMSYISKGCHEVLKSYESLTLVGIQLYSLQLTSSTVRWIFPDSHKDTFSWKLHTEVIKVFSPIGITRLSDNFCPVWQISPLIVWHSDNKQQPDELARVWPFCRPATLLHFFVIIIYMKSQNGVSGGLHSSWKAIMKVFIKKCVIFLCLK